MRKKVPNQRNFNSYGIGINTALDCRLDKYILFTLRLYCRVKPWLQTGHQTLLFLTLPAAAGLELLLLSLCCCCMGLLAA